MICPWEKTPGKYRIPATPALQENYPAISDSCTTVSYRIKNNTFAATGAGTMRTVKKIFSPEPENRTDTAAKPGLRAYHAAAHFAVFSGCQVPVAVLCIAVLHICIMTGCSHEIPDFPGGTMTSVTFRLPDYPNETHPPLVGWHIETVSRGITRTQFIPAETDCITMDIPAGKAIPFLCYPITGTQDYPVRFFRPGGCIYPYQTTAEWQNGYTAAILARLQTLPASSTDRNRINRICDRFNWAKLTSLITKQQTAATGNSTYYSPWLIDTEKLSAAILSGKATSRSLSVQKTVTIQIQTPANAPVYCPYIPEHPPLIPANGGTVTLTAVDCTGSPSVHQENQFLQQNKILLCRPDKYRQTGLVITEIERYTGIQ